MKITDIKFGMLRVPRKTPFKTALRTVDTVESGDNPANAARNFAGQLAD